MVRQKLGFGKSYSVKTSWYGIKIYEEFERFMAGRVDWAGFVNKLYEACDRFVNDMLYTSFADLATYVSADCSKSDTTLTLQTVVDLAEYVQTSTGHEVMLAGTRSAISALGNKTAAGWVSDNMRDERNTTGVLGHIEGIPTMVIPQVFKQGTRTYAYDNKTIMVLPMTDNKPIKLVNEGDSQFFEVTDGLTNMDMTITAEYQFKMGVAVIIGMDFGVYKFTNV